MSLAQREAVTMIDAACERSARLDALATHYLQSAKAFAGVRQAHIEALGDALCEPERPRAFKPLVEAQAKALDLHTHCTLAYAAALEREMHEALARSRQARR